MLFYGYLVRGGFQYKSVLPCYSMVIWCGEGFNIRVCSHVIQGYLVRGGFQYRSLLPYYPRVIW